MKTPREIAMKIIGDIERAKRLKPGSILSPARSRPVSQARHDAIEAVFCRFKEIGSSRAPKALGRLFNCHWSTIYSTLIKRGLLARPQRDEAKPDHKAR